VYCQTLPPALQPADVERVQRDELALLGRLDVRRPTPLSRGQLASGALGERPRRLGAVDLEQRQPFPARLQASPVQQPASRAGPHPEAAVFATTQLVGQLSRPPGRPGQSQGHTVPVSFREDRPRVLLTE
jgi:hypothetical protein